MWFLYSTVQVAVSESLNFKLTRLLLFGHNTYIEISDCFAWQRPCFSLVNNILAIQIL